MFTLATKSRSVAAASLVLAFVAVETAFPGGPPGPSVLINEVLYDAAGFDDGRVFVEIGGPSGYDLSGHRVRFVIASGGLCGTAPGSTTLPPGSIIGPDGLFVIADGNAGLVTQVIVDSQHNGGAPDLVVASFDPQDGPGTIQLLSPSNALLDVVGYGPVSCTNDSSGNAMFEVATEPDAPAGFSIARNPHLGDTDDNAADFAAQLYPTPGAPATTFAPNIPRLDLDFFGPGAVSLLTIRNGPPNGIALTLLSLSTGLGMPIGGTVGSFLLGFPIYPLFTNVLDASGSSVTPIAYPTPGLGPYFVALQSVALPPTGDPPIWSTNLTLTEGVCPCSGQSSSAIGVANYIDWQSKWEITINGPASCAASSTSLFTWVGVVHIDTNGNETLLSTILYAGGSLSASGFKSLTKGERIEFRCFDCSPQLSSGFSTTSTCYKGLLATIEC